MLLFGKIDGTTSILNCSYLFFNYISCTEYHSISKNCTLVGEAMETSLLPSKFLIRKKVGSSISDSVVSLSI